MDALRMLIPIIALMIPIVAIATNNWRRVRLRELALAEKRGREPDEMLVERLERLERRVQVLERLATDRGVSLADEIDRLER